MTLHTPTHDATRSPGAVPVMADTSDEEDGRFYDYDTCNVLLGKGGGGAVFLARARHTGSLIAVKRCYVRGPFRTTSPAAFSAHMTSAHARRLQPLPAVYSELQRSASSDDVGEEYSFHGGSGGGTNRLGPPRPLSAIPVTATLSSVWGAANSRHERDMQEESNHEVCVQRTTVTTTTTTARPSAVGDDLPHRGALPWSHALVHENASTVPCPYKSHSGAGKQLFWSPQRWASEYDHSCPPTTTTTSANHHTTAASARLASCAEEARILRALGPHPHIVAFLGSYTSARKVTFVAMELMHSDVARELQRGNTALMREEVCAVVAFSMLQALAHLHSHGIAHRDVKPGNIMLRRASGAEVGRGGMVVRPSRTSVTPSAALVERPVNVCDHDRAGKLVTEKVARCDARSQPHDTPADGLVRAALGDFSAAHFVHLCGGSPTSQAAHDSHGYLSHSGVRGTLHYKAPEQLLGGCIADYTACDMWALGCTLVEMLTGSVAFSGERELQVQMQIFHRLGSQFDAFPAQVRPATLFDSVPGSAALLDLLHHLLALDPAQRYTAAEALMHPFFAPLRTQYEHVVQSTNNSGGAVAVYFPLALRYTRACEVDVRRLCFRPIVVTPHKTRHDKAATHDEARVTEHTNSTATTSSNSNSSSSTAHVADTLLPPARTAAMPQEQNTASFLSEDGPSVHLSTLHSCLYATPQPHGSEAASELQRATVMLVDRQQQQQQEEEQQGMSTSPSLRWPTKECGELSPTARRLSIASSRLTGRATRRLSSHASSERNTTSSSEALVQQAQQQQQPQGTSAYARGPALYEVSPLPLTATQPPPPLQAANTTTAYTQVEAAEHMCGVGPVCGARKMLCFESPLPPSSQAALSHSDTCHAQAARTHGPPVIALTSRAWVGDAPQRWSHIPPCSLVSPALVRAAAAQRRRHCASNGGGGVDGDDNDEEEERGVVAAVVGDDASRTQYSTGLPLLSCRSTPSCTPELHRYTTMTSNTNNTSNNNNTAVVMARPVPPLPIPLALANARQRAAQQQQQLCVSVADSAGSSSPIALCEQKSGSAVRHDDEDEEGEEEGGSAEQTRQSLVLHTPQVQRSDTRAALLHRRRSALVPTSRSRPRSEGGTNGAVNASWGGAGEAVPAVMMMMWPRRPQRHCTPSVDSQPPQQQQQAAMDESVCYDNQDNTHAGFYAESATKRRRVEQSI